MMKFETADQNITWDIRLSCPFRDKVKPLVQGLQLYSKINMKKQRLVNAAILVGAPADIFFVVTSNACSMKITNPGQFWERELKKQDCGDLNKLSDLADFVHVRHFTRMSQRYFMWGDCEATREDVQRAAENEADDDLLKIMPAAAKTISKGDLQMLPALWDMASGGQLPALADCTHDFFYDQTHKDRSDMYMQEVRSGNLDWSEKQPYQIWCGPCHRCSSDGASDWTMCKNCKAVWCFDCATTYAQEDVKRKRALAAYHS